MNTKVYILGPHGKKEIIKKRTEHHESDDGRLDQFFNEFHAVSIA